MDPEYFVKFIPKCVIPRSTDAKASACNAGDLGLIPWIGKIPLEKEMATHSSILAWRIPCREEPGEL